MATRYEHKMAAERADATRVLARAAELSAGAPPKFGQSTLEEGLRAFLEAKRLWQRYEGDPRDYLREVGVNTLYGNPHCHACAKYFSGHRQYATHMLGVDHAMTSRKTSVAILNEVRAHIEAFPIDRDDFWSFDSTRVLKSYQFRGAPARNSGGSGGSGALALDDSVA